MARGIADGSLFGAPLSGPGISLIDATYSYGFGRLAGKLPANTFGGYPTQYWSTAYNAGYGEWGLASDNYRDQGILSYEFMIADGRAARTPGGEPAFPNPGSPWTGTHPESGNSSSPHAWGMANANMVLLDSLAAQRADGSLVVGRGVPDSWVRGGQAISLANFPTTDGRHIALSISTSGTAVTLTLRGDQPSGPVLFELPAFVNNIAHASAGTVKRVGRHRDAPGHGAFGHGPAHARRVGRARRSAPYGAPVRRSVRRVGTRKAGWVRPGDPSGFRARSLRVVDQVEGAAEGRDVVAVAQGRETAAGRRRGLLVAEQVQRLAPPGDLP